MAKTTPEQQRKILAACRSRPGWQSVRPEILYEQPIRYKIMRIERRIGKPPEIVWL